MVLRKQMYFTMPVYFDTMMTLRSKMAAQWALQCFPLPSFSAAKRDAEPNPFSHLNPSWPAREEAERLKKDTEKAAKEAERREKKAEKEKEKEAVKAARKAEKEKEQEAARAAREVERLRKRAEKEKENEAAKATKKMAQAKMD